ncbi:hypothetical protein [Planctomicrobium piriforme]|uniref:Uncharacterized protein n=1 Tax=Planctomicrobium piriforme TaxID=1576369 RepID=A0A1I3L310_9PLAN|nr:hypothetical protein [Planctomicrobium piriforme]SFI79120.1 hypothetical protein SAMN05421753_112124 [Planctomicrobium piriforme]
MSSEDFFKTVDESIGNQKQKEASEDERERELEEYYKTFVDDAEPLIRKYADEMRSRGIITEASSTFGDCSFKLYYADGGFVALRITGRRSGKGMAVRKEYTNDDGRNYFSDDLIFSKTFGLSNLESVLQDQIKQFLYYAPRHGGVSKNM